MDRAGQIFVFDLHNTLYDEVSEYAGAIDAAISVLPDAGKEKMYEGLSRAHARLGSDWDDEAWSEVASGDNKSKAIEIRRKVSEELTRKGAYRETLEAIRLLKDQGAGVYVATEATQNALCDALRWLNLDGIIDVAYAWPSAKPYLMLQETEVRAFPGMLEKPHPLIIGTILLDIAKERGVIPAEAAAEVVFELRKDRTLNTSSLRLNLENGDVRQKAQGEKAVEAIETVLIPKNGPYRTVIEDLRQDCFYVGDSFFKDGFLARNAGVPFIYAQYGKAAVNQKAQDTLYRVTGWNKFLLQLTQEAGKLPELTDLIKPAFVCEQSFAEFLDL